MKKQDKNRVGDVSLIEDPGENLQQAGRRKKKQKENSNPNNTDDASRLQGSHIGQNEQSVPEGKKKNRKKQAEIDLTAGSVSDPLLHFAVRFAFKFLFTLKPSRSRACRQ
jgi:hypothetical protein